MKTATMGMTAALLVGLWAGAARADGYIGVQIRKTDDDKGVVVQATQEDSPAARAGLKPDDLIVKVDGKDFEGLQGFIKVVRGHKKGDVIALTIFRDGNEQEIKVTVGEPPAP